MPVFYLGALRNAEDEFSSRSQFWGRLLKEMEIPQHLECRVQRVLDLLNRRLLNARVTAGGGASHLLPGRSRREKYVNRAANWIYLSARRGGNLRPAGGRRVEEPPAGGPVWEPAGGAGYSLSSGAPCTSRGCR